jgi:hypothetical protein
MDPQEQRAMARRLAEGSNIFDFDAALRVVEHMPERAERILREREEWRQLMKELDRAHDQMRRSALEFR